MKEQIIISPIPVYNSSDVQCIVSCLEYPLGVVVPLSSVTQLVNNLLSNRNEISG